MALTWEEVNAVTEKKWMPKLVDNIFKSNPLLDKLSKKMVKMDGGISIMVPLNYAAGTGGWYSGTDSLDNTQASNIAAAEFTWKQAYESISITRRDELMNSGDAAKLNFVKSKLQVAEKSLKDRLSTGLYNAGSDSKAILGVRCFVTTSSTYGGISQSSYSWWQSNVDSTSTVFSLSAIQTQWGTVSLNGDTPDIIVSDVGNFNRLWSALQPQQRFMSQETADAGFVGLSFNNAPWYADNHAPSNSVYLLNTEYLKLIVHPDENMRFEPFAQLTAQNVKVAHIYHMTVLASTNNRMHAGLTALAS